VYSLDTAGQWIVQSTPVSSTNKTHGHDITEILLKVLLNTINLNILIKVCISYESLTKSNVHQLSRHLKRKKILNTLKAVDFSCFLFSIMNKQLVS